MRVVSIFSSATNLMNVSKNIKLFLELAHQSPLKLHLHIAQVYELHIITDVLWRVAAMSPSLDTQLFQKTVMVRDGHWPVFISTTLVLSPAKLKHSSSKVMVHHGLALCVLLTTSWSAPVRVQCQSPITPLATSVSCPHTQWWLVQISATRWSVFSRTSRSVRIFFACFWLFALQNIPVH